MSDVRCPYCDFSQDIDHDDSYGYEEDRIYNQSCRECEKYFVYTTSIHFYYDVEKADCLNGGEHKYKKSFTYPSGDSRLVCEDCGETKLVQNI
jgi:hypothetical protein